jgi:hypothetical protein
MHDDQTLDGEGVGNAQMARQRVLSTRKQSWFVFLRNFLKNPSSMALRVGPRALR